jgi:hypothetical protein
VPTLEAHPTAHSTVNGCFAMHLLSSHLFYFFFDTISPAAFDDVMGVLFIAQLLCLNLLIQSEFARCLA